jgi:hypothetical protein
VFAVEEEWHWQDEEGVFAVEEEWQEEEHKYHELM